jgi:hypothetical protein
MAELLMQVESDMNHPFSQFIVSLGIPLPVMINSSSQKAFDKISQWINFEISERTGTDQKSTDPKSKESSNVKVPNGDDYLSYLITNTAKDHHHLLVSHISHVIISLFPTLTAVLGWSLVDIEDHETEYMQMKPNTILNIIDQSFNNHPPILNHHMISKDEKSEIMDFKLNTLTTIATSPKFLKSKNEFNYNIEKAVPLKGMGIVVKDVTLESIRMFMEVYNGEICGNAKEIRYDHFGMPWARGLKMVVRPKEE